ncbi:alpha-ketoglutarate dependent xanthine dioxygenase [Grosmannia clavigera kw1407]|uniref:Alpha-ketoglutarate dependent xanthine dioxygenase n=1 Tax=Grosmannia clavigera (strain kw1407 / UAMH 11150) TaxID=655863 RepID=F0XDS3_GROCL|nr:alpha-ketoglutarate dependent xanthine dioxygenase [Grosmannia clavigera kw1407]EFX04661.1 alpha-ketoglutarate dependent xanthine dioxygenase [Grosmannia clavigera kw1407]
MVITSVITEETADLHLVAGKGKFMLSHAEMSPGRVVPMEHGSDSKADFGALVYGIDLNNFTDADFALISDALHRHKLLVFKGQPQMLEPQQQYKLTSSFDPDEAKGGFAHGADPLLTTHNGVKIYGIPKRPAIPVQPQVHILGRGPLPTDHYGFPPGFEVQGIDHADFHLPPHIAEADRAAGASRFYQWHFDGALYKIPPPRVGCLLAVRTPKGPDVTVRWDDGSGREMFMAPGATAMVAGSRALVLLDAETRAVVLHSRIEYAPHAFVWMSTARSSRLGHLIETEGREMPLDRLPAWDPAHVCVYPMVWTNPVTGEQSLQVHGQGARRLFLKSSPDGEETVVEDLAEVRAFMDKIMRPVLSPENIYAHRHEEQDVILWYNRALWHSITEFPKSYGPRVMHQCNVAASDHPTA